MVRWRLIAESEPRNGALNMAVDETLFQAAEDGAAAVFTLRLYGWSPACLSIGFHQDPSETVDEGYCRERGLGIVRRPTGGKAVLHDDEVTYAVIGRQDLAPFTGLGLVETYGLIAEALAVGLRSLGLDIVLSQRSGSVSPAGGAPCFLIPSEKEITCQGRKIVGSAQRRGKRAFLQHGAIPLTLDYEALALASGQPLEHAAGYRRAFAGVADFRPGVTRDALASAIAAGFQEAFPGLWEDRPLDTAELAAAAALTLSPISQPSSLIRHPSSKRSLPCSN